MHSLQLWKMDRGRAAAEAEATANIALPLLPPAAAAPTQRFCTAVTAAAWDHMGFAECHQQKD